jgi:hypothetical protein
VNDDDDDDDDETMLCDSCDEEIIPIVSNCRTYCDTYYIHKRSGLPWPKPVSKYWPCSDYSQFD